MIQRTSEEEIFGVYLRDIRKQADLSQRTLATISRLDSTYISKLENGKSGTKPSDAALLIFADALGSDRDEMFWAAGKITPDIRNLMLEIGPEQWRRLRNHYTGTRS